MIKKKELVEDFSDLRVGAPVGFSFQDDDGFEIKCEGRIEAVGWDWTVIRYTEAGEDYLFLSVDLEKNEVGVLQVEEEKILEINIKGIGAL